MFTPSTRLVCLLVGALAWPAFAGVNSPPAAPVITEPNVDGQLVNFEDVHMETAAFSDPDPGQSHLCSDFEIWLVNPPERIWSASCVSGVLLTHIHLGDGAFENSHDGLISLFPETQYQLRARHSDDSGDEPTRWSPFSQRSFVTSAASQIFPLELDDIGPSPAPTLTAAGGAAYILPGGAAPASIRVESASGALLLEFRGNNGSSNTIVNPPALPDHVPVRVVMSAAGLSTTVFPALDLAFVDENGRDEAIYLPAQTIAAGQSRYFWVALGGATFVGSAGQTTPDFSTLARAAGVPWRVVQPGYRVDLFATGFQLPVNIAFVPTATAPEGARHGDDPYFYVAELYGTIKVVTHDGVVSDYATNLLNFNPSGSFPGSGELGLAGIVVDANGDVYATLLYSANPPNDGPLYPRVVRFTSNDGGRTAATQTTILDIVGESMGASHQISNISFGPDDKLYVHIGDGFNVGTALNLNSYRGKIIRLNRNGTAPTDNPFYSGSNGINSQDYVFAYGVRNPFGGAWRAADGQHYEVENGPSVDRFAQVVRGRNFGWNGTDASMSNFAIYNWDPAHAPVNIAFVQPSTFAGSGFPAAAQDRAFITESGPTWATGPQAQGKRITYFNLTPGGTLAGGPTTLLDYNGNGKATAVALAAGPDGLYFSDLYKDVGFTSPIDRGANVLRVRYVGRADFSATRRAGCAAPFSVLFTDESDVPGVAARLWDFGDGATSTEANPTHTYTSLGAFNVRLTVTGTPGAVSTVKSAFITVGPRDGLLAEYYDVIDLSGPPALVRDEPNIFYNWGGGSPDPSIGADTFSARWTGKLVPPQNGTYTIRTRSDDGVRVFLDDFAIIDNWTDHGPTFDSSGPLLLTGGQEYDLRAEFYENGGGAVMELYWSGPFAEQPVPSSVLRTPTVCALVGDLNCDGVVSVGDIGAFVLALTDPVGYAATFPDCPTTHGDTNGDGFVTVGDISGFVSLLTGG